MASRKCKFALFVVSYCMMRIRGVLLVLAMTFLCEIMTPFCTGCQCGLACTRRCSLLTGRPEVPLTNEVVYCLKPLWCLLSSERFRHFQYVDAILGDATLLRC